MDRQVAGDARPNRGMLSIRPVMFQFTSVSKSFDGKHVLVEVDLTIAPRQITVLIGPSGCGKTTMLGLMTGLLQPEKGQISFNGAPMTRALLPSLRRHLGYVIQEGGLFPHLTALGNVTLMANYLGWNKHALAERVSELAHLTRLSPDLLALYPSELSGGQRQRIALMRALMLEPEVLLLDEPLGALDPMIRADLQDDLLTIFHRLRKTVILVTHDLVEASYFADQIVLMRDGQIVQMGSFEDLAERPAEAFVSRFVKAQQLRVKGT